MSELAAGPGASLLTCGLKVDKPTGAGQCALNKVNTFTFVQKYQ